MIINVDTIRQELMELEGDDLELLMSASYDEKLRRKTIAEAPQKAELAAILYLNASGTSPGDSWKQPTGAHDAYPMDWETTHNGKRWRSMMSGNPYEPGVSSWREVVSDTPEDPETPQTYPEWVQPTGGHDAYNIGDIVSFDGVNYRSTINANVWSPTGYPQGWEVFPD